jgi:hypothetical protein
VGTSFGCTPSNWPVHTAPERWGRRHCLSYTSEWHCTSRNAGMTCTAHRRRPQRWQRTAVSSRPMSQSTASVHSHRRRWRVGRALIVCRARTAQRPGTNRNRWWWRTPSTCYTVSSWRWDLRRHPLPCHQPTDHPTIQHTSSIRIPNETAKEVERGRGRGAGAGAGAIVTSVKRGVAPGRAVRRVGG